ncbi:MAG TPA: hypothetical protein PLP48_00700 [Acholeplasmataceae bacterium]|nr:hypothetical protein [Acholeplasmataceae bacterium]
MMKRIIVKKVVLLIMISITFFLFISTGNSPKVIARDRSSSVFWSGEDLEVSPLEEVDYVSPYVSFEVIIDHEDLIDITQTYVIEKATDLYHLSRLSMGEKRSYYLSLDYVLGQSIDYYDAILENMDYRFYPIGAIDPFSGTFDGQGFEITNLYFQTVMDEETYDLIYPGMRHMAMFSKLSESAHVHHFGLVNPIMIQPIEWRTWRYAAYLAGENLGTLDHLYVKDERGIGAGLHVDGAFHVAGLVSVNKGIMRDVWYASPSVRSRAVTHVLSATPTVTENYGIIEHVYYDDSIYLEEEPIHGIGIETQDFQNPIYFSTEWFYQDHYVNLVDEDKAHLVMMDEIYPTLQGLSRRGHELLIEDATDLLVMQALLAKSSVFRQGNYVLTKDIDMKRVARDAYQMNPVSFDGIFKSDVITEERTLYEHHITDGGSPMHYSIFNLTLSHAIVQNNRDVLSMFSVLFGQIQDINFRRMHVDFDKENSLSSSLVVAPVAGEMIHGLISNVHVQWDESTVNATSIYDDVIVSGYVAIASGVIQKASVTGMMPETITDVSEDGDFIIGGLVGHATDLTIRESISSISLVVPSLMTNLNHDLIMGGLIGQGLNLEIERAIFSGEITQAIDMKIARGMKIAGILADGRSDIIMSSVVSEGTITYLAHAKESSKISGIANVDQGSVTLNRILHTGSLIGLNPLNISEQERYTHHLELTFGLQTHQSSLASEGLFSSSNISINASFVDHFSGLIIASSSDNTDVFHSESKGEMTIYSTDIIASPRLQYEGLFSMDQGSIDHARQEGDWNIHLSHSTSNTYTPQAIEISGILSTLTDSSDAINLFHGGDILLTKEDNSLIQAPILISGIVSNHQNDQYSLDQHIIPESITFDQKQGPLHHALNAGDIHLIGSFSHDVYASGIITHQEGFMTQAINLGDISITNTSETSTSVIQAAGITNLLIGKHARIMDSANRGQIEVVQLNATGFAHAAGIAVRNDLTLSHTLASPLDQHHLAKILFTINYGDIYAWTETDETSYTITHETHSKASGILAIGVLSIINNVNYGNIYGKYLSSGLIGFLPLNRFGTLQPHEVYIANAIQYGQIRAIESYDYIEEIYSISAQNPTRTTYNAYGAMVGKIHTGTSTWAFAGDVTYPIDRIYFGYLLNIDPTLNMFANAPELSSSWADGFGNLQEANEVILNMLAYMATTNPNDQSKAPFTYFYQGGWIGQYMGKVIDDYAISEEDDGLFYEGFPFREKRPVYTGTDQYIRSYIDYISRDKVNPYLLNQLEQTYQQTFPGIYALSSSEGIGQGIFMPDNMDVFQLSPIDPMTLEMDSSWLGDLENPSSIIYQFEIEMRQIQQAYASVIYDLELEQKDAFGEVIPGGMKLSSPEIDESRGLITYYIPSNASLLFGQTVETKSVYRFIEVSEGIGQKVPDLVVSGEQTYTWVGEYKKQGDDFVQIGPYHTTGTAMVTTGDVSPVDSYSRNNPVYSRQTMATDATLPYLYKHTPHTFILFVWYASGYRAQVTSGLAPGYGAYETYTLSGYPTLYRYVGPSRETVTYVRSDTPENVQVFDPSHVYFGVNLDTTSSTLSYGASLTYQGSIDEKLSTIPRSYGIYEAMYDADGNYIDSVTDHYGRIRVYSNAYEPEHPATYRDYTIRIIRTAPQSITDVTSLHLEGVDVKPATYSPELITSTTDVEALNLGETSIFMMTYQTFNLPDRYHLLPITKLMRTYPDEEVDPIHYTLSQGYVLTSSDFENQTGTWGVGTVTLELEIKDTLPSGDYALTVELITGDIYQMVFTKAMSSIASVTSITYQGITSNDLGTSLVSDIPYGIFYDALLEETKVVDFENLADVIDISYDDIGQWMPSYLEDLTLSRFSMIEYIEFLIENKLTSGYQYIITYHLKAEDGTRSTFTHILREKDPILTPETIYQSGLEKIQPLVIMYQEAPSIRITYAYDDVFIYPDHPWMLHMSFEPLNGLDIAVEERDYQMSIVDDLGFEIDFSEQTPMGTYTMTPTYQQTKTIWNQTLEWSIDYEPVEIHKVMNDQSTLVDILFVSDAIFQGFNTIIDPEVITYEDYQTLIAQPNLRKIVHLPTTGILYGDYPDEPAYYMIGQVQQTELTYYAPQFELPDGAIIKRVTDDVNIDPSYQSDILFADFSQVGDSFGYIHYRIYAMDYIDYPTHYTDYYIAVQDMTNTIRFDISIVNEATIPLDSIYVKINLCPMGTPEEPICTMENRTLSMGWYAHLNGTTYEAPVFQTTSYGSYTIELDVPRGYHYQIMIQEVVLMTDAFYVEHSIFPRKIYVTLLIQDDASEIPWGLHDVVPIEP